MGRPMTQVVSREGLCLLDEDSICAHRCRCGRRAGRNRVGPECLGRSGLSAPLRGLPRQAPGRPNAGARGASGDDGDAHPAHARLRRDDDHRLSRCGATSARRWRLPRQVRRRARPAAAAFCRDRSVDDSTPAVRRSGTAGARRRDNARFAPAVLAGLTAAQVPRLDVEVGVRLRRRYLGVLRSQRSSAISCSSAAPAAWSTRCAPTLAACSGRSRPTARSARRSSRRR